MFDTDSWEKAFYKKNTHIQTELFETTASVKRSVTIKQIDEWVEGKLKECFPYVSKPLPLPSNGAQLYSLFFCVSNSSPKAIGLAQKVANHILKQH